MEPATNRNRPHARDCLVLCSGALLLLVFLPLLAIAAFVLRPLVVAVALLAIVGAISPWVIVPRMRGRWQADVAPEQAYRGLRLARDVGVHPGHSWAWIGDGEVVVGADDLTQAGLGRIDGIELPAQGQRVTRDEPLFRLRHGDRVVELPAPISGTVVGCNEELRRDPELINRRPFSLGWVTRLRAGDALEDERRRLLFGRRAWQWFRGEVDRALGPGGAGMAG